VLSLNCEISQQHKAKFVCMVEGVGVDKQDSGVPYAANAIFFVNLKAM